MSASGYLDLCTIELVCARDKTVVASLRIEMRDATNTTRLGNLYRKLRVSEIGTTPKADGYDWAAAFAETGDRIADGRAIPLTVALKVGEGVVLGRWVRQNEVKVKVRMGQTVRVEILAVDPVQPQARPRAQAGAWDAFDADSDDTKQRRQDEINRANAKPNWGNAFDGLFSEFAKAPQAKPQPQGVNAVWLEIEAVLKRKRYTCEADIGRARRAMALLLHSDAAGNAQEADALARANAFLDEREKPFKPAIDAA